MLSLSMWFCQQQQLLAQLDDFSVNPKASLLIQVFSTQDPQLVKTYVASLKAAYPNAVIIGMSSSHLIYKGKIKSSGTVCLVSYFKGAKLQCGKVRYSDDPFKDSQLLQRQLANDENTQAIVCFANNVTAQEQGLFSAFETSALNIPLVGGASASTAFGRWVLLDDEIITQGYVAVSLSGDDLHVFHDHFIEWNPIGKKLVVTQSMGNTVHSLNQQSTLDVYQHYLANGGRIKYAQLNDFPLMRGEGHQQRLFSVVNVHDDGSIEFNEPLSEGDEVRLCYQHPSLTVEQIRSGAQCLSEQSPEQCFIYNCFSRLDGMESNTELQPFQALSDSSGVYCMAEFCLNQKQHRVMHHSLSYLALREGKAQPILQPTLNTNEPAISPLFSLIHNAFLDASKLQKHLETKVTEQAAAISSIYHIDPCTGLPNRAVLQEAIGNMKQDQHLLTMKMANFTLINEKYGYQVGDKLLSDITYFLLNTLMRRLKEYNQLYSIGIGEWALIFSSASDEEEIHAQIVEFVNKMEGINFEPLGLPDIEHLSISLTVGMVSKADFLDASSESLLLKSIDARRNANKNNKHYCNANSLIKKESHRQDELDWLSRVSRAIVNKNVITHGQPIKTAIDHQLKGYECLVRIQDGSELIMPGAFLPMIKDSHLYSRLSRQMIRQTFAFMRDRSEFFTINLAPQDFMNERTLTCLEDAIKTISDRSRIGLEVLESEQIKDYNHMIQVCNYFKSLGVCIVVDDFGSGFSNIDEIIKLEPNIIKLDGSLVRTLDVDKKQRNITEQLVRLCGVFQAKTVAEFVHNEAVCKIAEDIGFDYLQGYYLGKPELLR